MPSNFPNRLVRANFTSSLESRSPNFSSVSAAKATTGLALLTCRRRWADGPMGAGHYGRVWPGMAGWRTGPTTTTQRVQRLDGPLSKLQRHQITAEKQRLEGLGGRPNGGIFDVEEWSGTHHPNRCMDLRLSAGIWQEEGQSCNFLPGAAGGWRVGKFC